VKTSIELSKSLSEMRSLNLTTRGGPACGSTQSGSRSQNKVLNLYGWGLFCALFGGFELATNGSLFGVDSW